jgi:hypothetical protein
VELKSTAGVYRRTFLTDISKSMEAVPKTEVLEQPHMKTIVGLLKNQPGS